ncbi:MAG: Tetratricopeptide repeat protein [Cyanobacteriota bacterium erpe_2018_sw_21hr_WHONDRS-SW48-000092_B_bin.40]|nr:Tetratricopeptide repeat protein [Cyanobacteriota bacterium erpe_2018_sw_21hr_WHONDRS-SW48-000092_B_bin.40]
MWRLPSILSHQSAFFSRKIVRDKSQVFCTVQMLKKNIAILWGWAAQAAALAIALVIVSSLCTWPAQAGDFEQGCEFYKAKSYSQARTSFEKAAKTYPQNSLVHYYLANTYLSSGQSANAIREYKACLRCQPNSATTKYCLDALQRLTGVAPLSADASGSSGSATLVDGEKSTKAEAKPDVKEAAAQAIIAADRARAEEILKRANDECKAIRAEAKERIANGKLTGNQWFRKSDGTHFVDLLTEEKDAITKEAEDRCEAIMRTAETSASRLQH